MTVSELADRRATPREKRSLNTYRRTKDVTFQAIADAVGIPMSSLRMILEGYPRKGGNMLSDLRRIRAAIDEIVAEAKA